MIWNKKAEASNLAANISEEQAAMNTQIQNSISREILPQQAEKEINVLDMLIKYAPMIQKLFPIDSMINLTDREKCICYLPGKELRLPKDITGQPLGKGSAVYKAINTGQAVYDNVPKEVYGIPFKATGVPIKDSNGNIMGGIGLGISLSSQETLMETVYTVASTSQQISATTEELASSAEQLAHYTESLQALEEKILKEVGQTDTILNFINEVATNSNLLGLNAAIEAARAGEHGRGFTVVADEIRKMSVKSASSVKEIKDILMKIKNMVNDMAEELHKTSTVSQQLAAASEEISASMQELASSTGKIEQIAKII